MPFVERRVPIVADERVEPEFGTGALKVTPGHDPVDFEIGRAHGLPEPMVVGSGRADERRRPRGRGDDPGGGRRARPRLVRGAGTAREARAVPAHDLGLRALREPDRAADLLAVVVPHGRAQGACARGAAHRARALPPGVAAPLRDRLARERARLEHLAADLVGPPDPGLVLRGWSYDRRGVRARRLRGVRLDRARARPGRARHLVLLRPLAVRHPRLAGRHARPPPLLPRRLQHHRPRDHPTLGEPDDLRRDRARGESPVPRRDHPLDRARDRRPAHVEIARHRCRPARGDRRVRGRRDALRPREDVLPAGLAHVVQGDRRRSAPGEQALERLAPDPPEHGRRHARVPAARPRGALDPRPYRRECGRRWRRGSQDSTSPTSSRRSTT